MSCDSCGNSFNDSGILATVYNVKVTLCGYDCLRRLEMVWKPDSRMKRFVKRLTRQHRKPALGKAQPDLTEPHIHCDYCTDDVSVGKIEHYDIQGVTYRTCSKKCSRKLREVYKSSGLVKRFFRAIDRKVNENRATCKKLL